MCDSHDPMWNPLNPHMALAVTPMTPSISPMHDPICDPMTPARVCDPMAEAWNTNCYVAAAECGRAHAASTVTPEGCLRLCRCQQTVSRQKSVSRLSADCH